MADRKRTSERFWVGGEDEAAALTKGFAWLFAYASDNGYSRAALVLPGVRNIGYLDRFIGERAGAVLKADRMLEVDGLTISVYGETRPPVAFESGPILAVWPYVRSLDRLDALGAPAVCAVAWRQDELEDRAAWDPDHTLAQLLK